jgi:hypothetical protein
VQKQPRNSPVDPVGALSIGLLALRTRAGFVVLPRHLEALPKNIAISNGSPCSIIWVDRAIFEHRNFYGWLALLPPVPVRHALIRKHERRLSRIIAGKSWAYDRADDRWLDDARPEVAAEEEDEVIDRAGRIVQP